MTSITEHYDIIIIGTGAGGGTLAHRLAPIGKKILVAVSTSLSFALKAGNENNLVVFGLAVGITALLVGLERFALWLLVHLSKN
ncbi:hypothetical protein [Nostoc punctiforme]|uniref:Uncharacterized protein n=1 Tax=Nostoc punctiforme (strain ATCC 29133 / PCC 73102) TaxID=63737 RepID=B2IXR2_NOSP7|nr:hypothetical protein [Nostoc punctiforme]ACC81590.1 hypothetical protein Npun_F3109 [Nostoc punctiforme PCC 73102]